MLLSPDAVLLLPAPSESGIHCWLTLEAAELKRSPGLFCILIDCDLVSLLGVAESFELVVCPELPVSLVVCVALLPTSDPMPELLRLVL